MIGILTSGATQVLAEFVGEGWSLMNSNWSLQLRKKLSENGHIFELTGIRKVSILFFFFLSKLHKRSVGLLPSTLFSKGENVTF